jgi:cell division protein FtsB
VYWILMVLVVTAAYLYYREPLPEPMAHRLQVLELQQQEHELNLESKRLARRVEWLKDKEDPGYLVIEARENLGMQRHDEVLIKLPD